MEEFKKVPIKSILIDEDFNARKRYVGIDDLAEQIKRDGLITPPVVSNGGGKDKPYRLIAGFRRIKAAQKLGWADIMVQVRETKDDLEAKVVNISENVNREELTSYEFAWACRDLKERYKLSGAAISALLSSSTRNVSASHVANLVSATVKLHPKILKAWADNDPNLTLRRVFELYPMPPEKQLEHSESFASGMKAADVEAEGEGKGGTKTRRRASEKQLRHVLVAAKSSELDLDTRKAVVDVLRFALGDLKRLSIEGNQLWPAPKEAEESDEDDE